MIPVSVRLSNSAVDIHITQRISGLSWRTVVPGGYASATFALERPITLNDPMLAPFTRVYIYDARNGNTLWEGKLALPGRSATENGQVWSLTAVGPSAHTLDQQAPLVYIDHRLDKWVRSTLEATAMPASASVSVANHPHTTAFDAVIVQAGPGVPQNGPGTTIAALYEGFADTGMHIGAIGFSWDVGATTAQWVSELVVGGYPTYATIPFSAAWNVAGGVVTCWVIDDFAANMDIAAVRIVKISGGNTITAGDTTWGTFADLRILGRRMLQNGTLVSGGVGMGSSSIYVRASWVVGDLLGRMLPQYDGTNAVITGDTVDIDQLAYDDPATPNQVLDDLMALEPSTYWAAWESNAAGKYRFEWSTWPTTVRYEATVDDGFDSPSPTFEVYNRVKVRYRDARGRIKWLDLSQPVPMLDNEGVIREGFVDLGDEAGSAANALLAGNNFLLEHRAPSSAGTLTIARPIRDLGNAKWAAPWEILPGQLIRVRGVEASRQLDDDTRDGVTVFRIVSVEANGEGQATLELDMFSQTEQRALANLINKRRRRR